MGDILMMVALVVLVWGWSYYRDRYAPNMTFPSRRWFACCTRCRGVTSEWFMSCMHCGIQKPLQTVWVPERDIVKRHRHDWTFLFADTFRNARNAPPPEDR